MAACLCLCFTTYGWHGVLPLVVGIALTLYIQWDCSGWVILNIDVKCCHIHCELFWTWFAMSAYGKTACLLCYTAYSSHVLFLLVVVYGPMAFLHWACSGYVFRSMHGRCRLFRCEWCMTWLIMSALLHNHILLLWCTTCGWHGVSSLVLVRGPMAFL